MKRAPAAAKAGAKPRAANRPAPGIDVEATTKVVLASLDDDKAEDILAIDIRGKSSFADMLVVASGRSSRHVGALADHVMRNLKEAGVKDVRVEGLPQGDWVLVDAGDVVIHSSARKFARFTTSRRSGRARRLTHNKAKPCG